MPESAASKDVLAEVFKEYQRLAQARGKTYGLIAELARLYELQYQPVRTYIQKRLTSPAPDHAATSQETLLQRIHELEAENEALAEHIRSLLESLRAISSARTHVAISGSHRVGS